MCTYIADKINNEIVTLSAFHTLSLFLYRLAIIIPNAFLLSLNSQQQ